jgi:plastocyanin
MRALSGLAIAAALSFLIASSASGCPRDGTSEPCQCLMKMVVSHPGISLSDAIAALPPALPELIQQSSAQQQVHVYNFSFSTNPAGGPITDATVQVGDTVHWTWDSGFHSVTSVAGSTESFDSGIVGDGSTFDHTFTHPGTYHYYCILHGFDAGNGTASGMAGIINVVPEPGAVGLGILLLAPLAGRRCMRRSH